MPHWNCERCGTRFYSAARKLKRETCPECQGRLVPERSSRFAGDPSVEVAGQSADLGEADLRKRR